MMNINKLFLKARSYTGNGWFIREHLEKINPGYDIELLRYGDIFQWYLSPKLKDSIEAVGYKLLRNNKGIISNFATMKLEPNGRLGEFLICYKKRPRQSWVRRVMNYLLLFKNKNFTV